VSAPDGDLQYLHVLDGAAGTLIASIPIPILSYPIAADPINNRIYVGYYNEAEEDGGLVVIDGAANSILQEIPISGCGGNPVIDPPLNRMYVCAGMYIVDLATYSVTRTNLSAGYNLAVNTSTHELYFASSDQLCWIDASRVFDYAPQTDCLEIDADVWGSQVGEIVVDSLTNRVYVKGNYTGSADKLYAIDGASKTIIGQTSAGNNREIAFDGELNRIYTLYQRFADVIMPVIDAPTMTTVGAITLGGVQGSLTDIAVNPVTHRVYGVDLGRGLIVLQDGDWDNDGLVGENENCPYVNNPNQADADADGVGDACDNCIGTPNTGQENTIIGSVDNGPVVAGDDLTLPYEDEIGDACDTDLDNDGLDDSEESADACPYVAMRDSDGDGSLDGYEADGGSDPCDPASRPPSFAAAALASGPFRAAAVPTADSDGDGLKDDLEVRGWGTSPNMRDSDGDRCDDDKEAVDVNGDGIANALDYARVVQRAFKIRDDDPNDGNPFPDYNMVVSPAFDVNKDGVVNAGDAALVVMNSNLVEPTVECNCR
jgi:hypothetical protein